MWKKDLNVLSGRFLFTADSASYPSIGLTASNLAVFSLAGIVNLACKVNEKADSEALESTVILYLDRLVTSLSMLSTVALVFMRARTSEVRWAETRKAERSWLEGYVPPCEVAAEQYNVTVTDSGSTPDVQQ